MLIDGVIVDGAGDDATEGFYAAGDPVTIKAVAAPAGMRFSAWTRTDGAGTAFTPPRGAEGEIAMPESDLTLMANYVKDTSGGRPSVSPGVDSPQDGKADGDAAENGSPADGALPFIDVSEGDWFFDDVAFVYMRGLMLGTDSNLFSPNLRITRGMMVTILGRLYGVSEAAYAGTESPFTDVDAGMYYAPYIRWAAGAGIVEGIGGGKFAPDADIKREDLILMLYRYTERTLGGEWSPEGFEPFADEEEIDDYAENGVVWATLRGLINGRPGNIFDPKSGATRAEVAAILRRFIEGAPAG
jgi:hypothetical protein